MDHRSHDMRSIIRNVAVFLLMGTTTLLKVSEGSTVCYSLAGDNGTTCFSNDPPFDNANDYLPQSPDTIDTKFVHYTKNGNEQIYADNLASSNDLQQRETQIIVHGFGGGFDQWATDMATALLDNGDCNVIGVDWSGGAEQFNYYRAAANTRLAGGTHWSFNECPGKGHTKFHRVTFISSGTV